MSDNEQGLFAAYSPNLFVTGTVWPRVETILRHNRGGNYGIAGPRGAGKTWLMLQAHDFATQNKGLATWFPSPSEYEAKAFLASLSEVTAQRYIESYLAARKYGTETELIKRGLIYRVSFFALISVASLTVVTVFWRHVGGTEMDDPLSLSWMLDPFLYLGLIVSVALVVGMSLIRRTRRKHDDERLYDRAVEIRTQARFTSAHKETGDASVGAKLQGLSAAFSRGRELSLAERPSTISSLIHDYRDFVQQLAAMLEGPIVVAIDELDKMHSPDDVAKLLRDVKGIFDVRGVHYFVSISDEAARSISLGPVRERNEFNSSFYQVFAAPSLGLAECKALLELRRITLDDNQLAHITVLSGGLPREVVRLADIVLSAAPAPSSSAGALIVREELLALQDQVERMSETAVLEEQDEFWIQQWIEALDKGGPMTDRGAFDDQVWSLTHASESWRSIMIGQWRKVLLRYELARTLEQGAQAASAVLRLQEVARRAERSAAVGRRLLEDVQMNSDVSTKT